MQIDKIKVILAISAIIGASLLSTSYVVNQAFAKMNSYITTSAAVNEHSYIRKKINGYNLEYISVNNSETSNYKVEVGVAKEGGQYLGEILKDNNAISGMNGAYFSPVAYGNPKNESQSERIHKGESYSKWSETGERILLGLTKNSDTVIYKTNSTNNFGNINEVVEGISNFPLILRNGSDTTSESSSLIDDKMKKKKDKTFICTNDLKEVKFGVIKNIDIYSMAEVLKQIGCKNALNLDAGASTGLVYNGDTKIGQASPVMDAIMVVKKTPYTEGEQKKINSLGKKKYEEFKYGIYKMYQKIK